MPAINGINMTNEEAFRYQWKWYYDHRCTRKKSFFEQNEVDEIPRHMCYACETAGIYLDEFENKCTNCEKCPIKWKTEELQDDYFCESDVIILTLYDKFRDKSLTFSERMDAALELSNVEWKEKIKLEE